MQLSNIKSLRTWKMLIGNHDRQSTLSSLDLFVAPYSFPEDAAAIGRQYPHMMDAC